MAEIESENYKLHRIEQLLIADIWSEFPCCHQMLYEVWVNLSLALFPFFKKPNHPNNNPPSQTLKQNKTKTPQTKPKQIKKQKWGGG